MGSRISIITDYSEVILEGRNANERRMKAVVQIDKEGNLVATFPSIAAAERACKIRHISECVNGIRNSAGGYFWFLQGDYIYGNE